MQVLPPRDGVSTQVYENFIEWQAWMQVSRGLLPTTITLYSHIVEQAQAEIPQFDGVSTEVLERWVTEKGGRSSTVSNRISALTSYFRFLVKTKRRNGNPALELDRPRRHRGVPKPIADLETVLQALDEVDRRAMYVGTNHNRYVGQSRDMAVFLVETGLRIHEAAALHVPVPIPRSMTIIGKGHKEAIVLLNTAARDALDRLGGEWPCGARATQRRFEKADSNPHAFRHTFATNLVRRGVEIGTVSKLCRHSSPSVTMIYAQYDETVLRAAIGD